MNNLEQFNEKLQVLPHDIRAEIIVADLLSEGMSVEDLVFKNRTVFSRNFHFDIERTSIIEIETTKRKKLCFEMNRDGMYDQLPEDLFHQVSEMLKDTDKEETIQEIKNQRSFESQCRLFFQPFEQEFYRERIKLEWQERKFLFQTNDFLRGDVFERIWNFPEFLDDEQKTKLGLLLPILHRIIGNLDLLQYIIENITGDQIQISINSPAITNLEEDPQMGEMRLNIDSILAGKMPALGRGFLISIT
ncbi:MAG TPA: hypothetical protein VFV08_04575, partial [Puia sp.]|nr:hypothetical protein [Puia sp.]